jgi:hypothetical protein
MSFSKILIAIVVILFGTIGIFGYLKKQTKEKDAQSLQVASVSPKTDPKEDFSQKPKTDKLSQNKKLSKEKPNLSSIEKTKETKNKAVDSDEKKMSATERQSSLALDHTKPSQCLMPSVDRINELFDVGAKNLSSIVETITYRAKVSWLPGRAAWIADYASHFATSRHFIARSLNGKPDYLTQKVSEGDTFNVLRKDIDLRFNLVIDLSCCKLFFYAHNATIGEKILLKSYNVGLGRKDNQKASGCLTPLGKYTLGSKVVTYKPGSMGLFHGESVEMIKIFGTRWIPFDKEVGVCSERAKGFGIHGVPWVENKSNQIIENIDCISKYESDGCIRLSTQDMEELFAIIITKPTVVEIVKNFNDATLPSEEVK